MEPATSCRCPRSGARCRSPRSSTASSGEGSALRARDALDLLDVAGDFVARTDLLRAAQQRQRFRVALEADEHLRMADLRFGFERVDVAGALEVQHRAVR